MATSECEQWTKNSKPTAMKRNAFKRGRHCRRRSRHVSDRSGDFAYIWGKRVVFLREQHEPFPWKPSHAQHEIECSPSTLRKCPRRYSVKEPKVLASKPNTRHVTPRVYICICKIFDMHLTMCNQAWRHEQSPTQGFTQGRPTQLHKALHNASKAILSARYSI